MAEKVKIKLDCPCKRKNCPRHGNCGECRRHHEKEGKVPPWCEKKKNKSFPRGKE